MKYIVLASGSKGNATLLEINNRIFLIDMGISKTRLVEGLKYFNKTIDEIDAVFITHEHTDHIQGLKYIKDGQLFLASQGTLSNENYKELIPFKPIKLFDVEIIPLPTSHDAYLPLGYIFKYNNQKLVYITDTGFIDLKLINECKNPTTLILESNHDKKMLLNSRRSLKLKKRILSDYGHLSNEDSALYASKIIGENTKEIILAHLSEECNTPELALSAYKNISKRNILVRCASQHEILKGYYEN